MVIDKYFLDLRKSVYKNSTAVIIHDVKKLDAFPLDWQQGKEASPPTPIQPRKERSSYCKKTRTYNKRHTDWKGRSKSAMDTLQDGCLGALQGMSPGKKENELSRTLANATNFRGLGLS